MKVILLSSILFTGCVSLPKYVERYTCTEDQKLRLPTVFTDCMVGTETKSKDLVRIKTTACYDFSLKSTCNKQPFFQHRDFLGRDIAPRSCLEAKTSWEVYVCEGRN